MSIKWRTWFLDWVIYVRKYDSEVYSQLLRKFKRINEEVCETLSDDEIHEIMVDNFQSEFKRVYPIPIHIRVTSYDN